MPVTAAIGAAGSIGSALIGSNAASSAAAQQAAAQQAALTQQQQMFGTAQNALNPFINAGQGVIPTLTGLLTPGTSASTLSQMPGFQFQSQYGTMAATNALAAKSGASAGPLATAISGYNNGLAGTTWQSEVNALQGVMGTGASAAGNLATGAINSGNAQASTLGNIGNAQAAGTLGSANAMQSGIAGLSNSLFYSQMANGGLYGGTGNAPATGAGSPSDFSSNLYAMSQGINPF